MKGLKKVLMFLVPEMWFKILPDSITLEYKALEKLDPM